MVRINLGCGRYPLEGFDNVDIYRTGPGIINTSAKAYIDKQEDNSVDFVYLGHFLEHLTREYSISLLASIVRALKPGGSIQIVVPDLTAAINLYTYEKADEFNSWIFGALDSPYEVHYQAFNLKILGELLAPFFKIVEIMDDSPYLVARVPWQLIVECTVPKKKELTT